MPFQDGFMGFPYPVFLLHFFLVVFVIILLQAYFQGVNVNQIFAPKGNPANDSYSTSLIQHKPVRQCDEDLQEDLKNKSSTDMKGCTRERDHLIAALNDQYQSKILVPVILPHWFNNQGQDPDSLTGQEPTENAWLTGDDSEGESVCSENDDLSEYGSMTEESKAVQKSDETAGTSQQLVSHSGDNAAVGVTVKSAKLDDGVRAENGSNQDFAPCDDGSSDQPCEEDNEPSDSDGDVHVTDSSSDTVVAHSVIDEEKSSSVSDELEISQQLESDDYSTSSVGTAVGTVPSAEPTQLGIQNSVADGEGITMSTSVEVARNTSDPPCEEGGTSSDDASDIGDEDSPRGALVPVETNSGNKFEEEDAKGHQTTEEEFLKEHGREGAG